MSVHYTFETMSLNSYAQYPAPQGLYRPDFEHDACGVGFVASVQGQKSNDILKKALTCVGNLVHRGAVDADAKSGDGAGVLTQIPHALFRRELEKMGRKLIHDHDLAVGMFFLPKSDYDAAHCRKIAEDVLKRRGLIPVDWREVPVNPKVMGDKAAATAPLIEQLLILRAPEGDLDAESYERELYLARNEIEQTVAKAKIDAFYIPSLSSKTIVYKGMFTATQLERFYKDLTDPLFTTAIAVYHQRYSTNTFPTWGLAHPFRMLAHNGEINTIRGNRNWVHAREAELASPLFGPDVQRLHPVIQPGGSDSASADNALELLYHSGRDLVHSLMMMVPAAFRHDQDISPEVRAFYEFHELIAEPWDGPAAIAVTDGTRVVACLDRNGLRPARYQITADGLIVMGSEVGLGQLPEDKIVEKGRLAPGEMIAIDTLEGRIIRNEELKTLTACQQPYSQWVKDGVKSLSPAPALSARGLDAAALSAESGAFGFTEEELTTIVKPMAAAGEEPLGSMGDDTPLAVLSQKPRVLAHYFRQLFAQVTNPPIDPIREKLVMDTIVCLGAKPNWLAESAEHAHQLRLDSPVLTNGELEALRSLPDSHLQAETLSLLLPLAAGESGFEAKVLEICRLADAAIAAGKTLLILSDRGTSADTTALPMLLAVGAVHHHLIRSGRRMRASIVCDTAEARDTHQFATLIGYGASAINPYLVWDSLAALASQNAFPGKSEADLVKNYRAAVNKGLLKIMSKMGISRLASYHGAQIFEAVGIGAALIDSCFTGTPSFVGGIGLPELARETLRRHALGHEEAASGKSSLAGFYRYRRDGEMHVVTPPVLQSLHQFVGIKGADKAGKPEDYKAFVTSVEQNRPVALRDLLRFKPKAPVPLDEVEPIEDIRARFTTAGMSLGAISPESHEMLAIAMNRIGGKSNSGEGGEDRLRFSPLENGDSKNSRIKQVASGRFGVTAEYLASAAEIEIKIAQGAKPGEGGQIPGHKVTGLIARLRHSTPGIMLISPPPHHDIYSIEDLAQLIYDLKQVNPRAKVCVKLVAEAGVGTIAAGVAKAHADIVLVSGHDGGTGASPLSSVKFAGSPWELGVAETQQVLLLNDLRNRITLRTDGGMRTGRDIVVAAALGAEEFNFGTAALLALGCVYVRQCHLNTCPVGIATQDEKLRGKFKGTAEGVVTYLNAVAQEVREIMAALGVRKMAELIGHTEFLEQISLPDHPKANTLDLSQLLHVPESVDAFTSRFHTWERNDKPEDQPLDERILQDVKSTLQTRKPITLKYKVRNVHRCIGTQLSGEIAFRSGDDVFPDRTINLELEGSAGQSLGTFLVKGVRLKLTGEANDYVGKGMSGGEILLVPHKKAKFDPSANSICGNTCLYGATGGTLYAYGRAGERFAVRNSGATAIVEGVGDHGCEYMTNGTIVVLGPTGRNFGAGMSGGRAFILDEAGRFESLINTDMVTLSRLDGGEEETLLQKLIFQHLEATESTTAKKLLGAWETHRKHFWLVSPKPAPVPAPAPAPAVAAKG